jgi:hypothetical protein
MLKKMKKNKAIYNSIEEKREDALLHPLKPLIDQLMARGLTIGIEIDVVGYLDEEIRKTRGVIADLIELAHNIIVERFAFVGIAMINDTGCGVLNEGTYARLYKGIHYHN